MDINSWLYAGFTIFVLGTLALDLGVFHRKAHAVRPKEAGIWVAIWTSLALVFAAILYFWKGSEQSLLFVTGYLIELSHAKEGLGAPAADLGLGARPSGIFVESSGASSGGHVRRRRLGGGRRPRGRGRP